MSVTYIPSQNRGSDTFDFLLGLMSIQEQKKLRKQRGSDLDIKEAALELDESRLTESTRQFDELQPIRKTQADAQKTQADAMATRAETERMEHNLTRLEKEIRNELLSEMHQARARSMVEDKKRELKRDVDKSKAYGDKTGAATAQAKLTKLNDMAKTDFPSLEALIFSDEIARINKAENAGLRQGVYNLQTMMQMQKIQAQNMQFETAGLVDVFGKLAESAGPEGGTVIAEARIAAMEAVKSGDYAGFRARAMNEFSPRLAQLRKDETGDEVSRDLAGAFIPEEQKNNWEPGSFAQMNAATYGEVSPETVSVRIAGETVKWGSDKGMSYKTFTMDRLKELGLANRVVAGQIPDITKEEWDEILKTGKLTKKSDSANIR